MNFIKFNNTEDMQAYLLRAQADADSSTHPAQRALTYGDHWVQFEDIANRVVIFGKVYTLTEVKFTEMYAGATLAEAKDAQRHTQILMAENKVYGRAHSILCPGGEAGYAHKSVLWPIEQSVYESAQQVGWNIDRLYPSDKINLEAAFIAYRGRNK